MAKVELSAFLFGPFECSSPGTAHQQVGAVQPAMAISRSPSHLPAASQRRAVWPRLWGKSFEASGLGASAQRLAQSVAAEVLPRSPMKLVPIVV